MITMDDIRRFATAFPEVEESLHFRHKQPVFKVKGNAFAGGEKGEATAVFSVSQEEAEAAIADDPAIYDDVWRMAATKSFVGLRVQLDKVSKERVQELVEHAWRNRAPKKVVDAYDAQ